MSTEETGNNVTNSSATAQALLADKTYDIEFEGYLSNHAKHAIVALDKLNASDERIQEYWNEYTTVTPYGLKLHKLDNNVVSSSSYSKNTITNDEEFKNLKGKKEKWIDMVLYLQKQQQQQQQEDIVSTDHLVQKYVPDLLPGHAGALLHGIIHLGWAIDAKSPWMVLEGIAYLNFCNIGIGPNIQLISTTYKGEEEQQQQLKDIVAIKSLIRISNEYYKLNLKESWIESTKSKYDKTFHPELVPAGFQWHVAKVLHDAHSIATNVPSWIQTLSLEDVWSTLYHAVIILYLSTRTTTTATTTTTTTNTEMNDKKEKDGSSSSSTEEETMKNNGNFIILHLLTSLWGLEQTCNVINNEQITRNTLEYYWVVMICLLCTSTAGMPKGELLEETLLVYPIKKGSDDDEIIIESIKKSKNNNECWDKTKQLGIAEKEEHNIKLVYVCMSLWKRYNCWNGFLEASKSFVLTPNIGPSTKAFKST